MNILKVIMLAAFVTLSTHANAALVSSELRTAAFNDAYSESMSATDFTYANEFSSTSKTGAVNVEQSANDIPVPAAVWLFASGLVGLIGLVKRKKSAKQ